MKTIFISTSYYNNNFNDLLINELVKYNFNVFTNEQYSGKISDMMAFDNIKKSSVIIAIINDLSPNVFLEVGYAIGQGKTVLLVCNPNIDLPANLGSFMYIRMDNNASITINEIVNQLINSNAFVEAEQKKDNYKEILSIYKTNREKFEGIDYMSFERAMKEWFVSRGYLTEETYDNHDRGYDILLKNYKNYTKTLVEIKKFNINSKVSISYIQKLIDLLYVYKADCGIIVTTSSYSQAAIQFAENSGCKIELWTLDDVIANEVDDGGL